MKFSSRLQEMKRVHRHMVRKLINAKEAQGVKTISLASGNPDMPTPPAIVEALTGDQRWLVERNEIYRKRRDIVVDGLRAIGLELQRPQATLYIWAKLPSGFNDSLKFSKWVLNETGVWITSGIFFGPAGEGYVRASITLPTDDLREAMERLQTLKL